MNSPGPAHTRQDVRYEPDDRPPLPITVGLGVQYAMLCIASIVLTPMIMITLAGGSAAYLSWAVFAALVISGFTTAVQARRVGRIGAGYILVMGSTSAFLAVSVTAIEQGGPGMLATLIIASAILAFTWAGPLIRGVEFRGKFFVVGALASFLSLFAGATGPLTAPFFLNSELKKEEFVPTKAACQTAVHLFKVAVYFSSGFLITPWLPQLAAVLPVVFIGSYLGKVLAGKIPEGHFRLLVKILITLLALRMILKLFV